MAKLVYLPQATRDIIEIRRYIIEKSGSRRVAAEFIGKLRKNARSLLDCQG